MKKLRKVKSQAGRSRRQWWEDCRKNFPTRTRRWRHTDTLTLYVTHQAIFFWLFKIIFSPVGLSPPKLYIINTPQQLYPLCDWTYEFVISHVEHVKEKVSLSSQFNLPIAISVQLNKLWSTFSIRYNSHYLSRLFIYLSRANFMKLLLLDQNYRSGKWTVFSMCHLGVWPT